MRAAACAGPRLARPAATAAPRLARHGAAAGLLLACLAASACHPSAPAAVGGPAPVALRAAVLLEPARLRLGDTARVELAVTTPPGWSVAPPAAPTPPDALWILEAERPVVERSASRWIHRSRFRVRTRATGASAWPAMQLVATDPGGTAHPLDVPERPFQVVAELGDALAPEPPFGFRESPGLRGGAPDWQVAALGAAAALAAVALVALVRRARRARQPGERHPGPEPPWRAAQAALAAAEEIAASDPVRAADMASAALRLYVARRYAAASLTATTEELAASEPPFAMTTRWRPLLDALSSLDQVRFQPADASRGETVRRAVRSGRELVIAMTPQGNWR